jgi:hypothetical protein
VKTARELIYTAERQASRDVGLAGLRLKPGSSHSSAYLWLLVLSYALPTIEEPAY